MSCLRLNSPRAIVGLRDTAGQAERQSQGAFGHRVGRGEGRVQHGHAGVGARVYVNVVDADTGAADRRQTRCRLHHLLGNLVGRRQNDHLGRLGLAPQVGQEHVVGHGLEYLDVEAMVLEVLDARGAVEAGSQKQPGRVGPDGTSALAWCIRRPPCFWTNPGLQYLCF